jgi:hypothetical protein
MTKSDVEEGCKGRKWLDTGKRGKGGEGCMRRPSDITWSCYEAWRFTGLTDWKRSGKYLRPALVVVRRFLNLVWFILTRCTLVSVAVEYNVEAVILTRGKGEGNRLKMRDNEAD